MPVSKMPPSSRRPMAERTGRSFPTCAMPRGPRGRPAPVGSVCTRSFWITPVRTGGNEWQPLTKGLPQSDCYVNVLREAMAVDSLDKCGIYFGTTGGQVYCSPDGGDNWTPIVRDLPAVLSVEVQTLK